MIKLRMQIKFLKKKFVIVLCIFIYFYPTSSFAGTDLIKIGVLAKRGTGHCLKKWSSTAEYLSNAIQDYTFKIIPIDFNQINQKVKNGDVDFILANSAIYVELEVMHGVNRIATLKNKRLSGTYTTFGGVVFCLTHFFENLAKNINFLWHYGCLGLINSSGYCWLFAKSSL